MAKRFKLPTQEVPDAQEARYVHLDTLDMVRREQGRLYRMLYSKKGTKLTPMEWDRGRKMLQDIRDTILAIQGKALPAQGGVTVNALMVSGGLRSADELLARFARAGQEAADANSVQDGSVLPAAVGTEP